jgi:hypothetical protein
MPLTLDLARRHNTMAESPTERGLDPSRVKYLREKAEQGQLVPFHWAVAKERYNGGRVVRMNGLHSSTMLTELDSFPDGLRVHLDEYEVDTPSDLATLFRQFDARKSSRTPSDVAGAYQGLHEELDGVPRHIAKLAVEGIGFFERYVKRTMVLAGDDQYTLFDEVRWHPFIKWLGELHSIKTPEMQVVPVAAAMCGTYLADEPEARNFWMRVSRCDGEDDEPSFVLDTWLKDLKDARFKQSKRIKAGNIYQGCAFAWEQHLSGKRIRGIRSDVSKGLLDPTE